MNNIEQKNVILKLRHTSDLPYRSIEYVNQFSECANITHVDVNNAMRQLLENDLYIENSLNSTSSYIVGPKTDENLDEKLNGYKTYGDLANADTLEVLHKVDKPLSSTIERIQDGMARFVTEWSGLLFVGRDGAALQYSEDLTSISFEELSITATNFYQDDDRILFSATDGVYQLSSYVEDDESSGDYGKTFYGAVRLNSNDMSQLQSVHLNKNTWKVTAGGQTGVYEGSYDAKKSLDELKLGIKFDSQMLFDEGGNIVSEAVSALGSDGRLTIAGTQSGIFQPGASTVFKDAQALRQYSGGVAVSKSYSIIAEFDGNTYVGAENGLFRIDGDALVLASLTGGNITANVVDIKVENETMYIATASSVYSVSKQLVRSADYLLSALPDNRIASSAVVRRILVDNGQVYVATSAGLYCFIPADIAYISEVCSTGQTRPLPVTDTAGRLGDVTDICVKNSTMIVGTSSGVFRLERTGSEQNGTKIVKELRPYSDIYGKTVTGSILKILSDDRLEGAYIVTSSGISHSSALERKWTPPDSDEQITDVVIADVGGTTRLLAVTTANTYMLKLGTGPSIFAMPKVAIPGVAVSANSIMIIVAGLDGKCRYVYNSLNKFKNGSFSELTCGISKFETFTDKIYGLRTDKGVSVFSSSGQPKRSEDLYPDAQTVSYAWSKVQNGYLFVRDGRLIFKELSCHVELGEDEVEASVASLDDVDDWYSEPDVTFVYVDGRSNIAYLGTTSGALSANLADPSGEKITKPVFEACACQAEYAFGRVNCIVKGYTASDDVTTSYSYGNYTILKPDGSTYVQEDIDIEEGWSVLIAAEGGLFEFKDGGVQFIRISETVYKTISATPKLFIGVTTGSKIHTCASTFSDSEITVPVSEGIQPGTESSPVTYTKHTIISPFSVREHTDSVPETACSIRTFDTAIGNAIYLAGGNAPIIKNSINDGELQTFQFSASQYSYIQSSINIECIQPPEDRQTSQYYKKTNTAVESYTASDGTIQTRDYIWYSYLAYDPICFLLFGKTTGYADYIMYAANGIYTVDNTNILVASSNLAAASGSNISNATGFCRADNKMFVVCGDAEGLQTVDHSFTRTNFLAEGMSYADGNYYFKTSADWRYMSYAQLMATDVTATADQATSLNSVFSAAGVAASEDVTIKADIDRTIYVGTAANGLLQIGYFTNEIATFEAHDVPTVLEGSSVYSLNSASRSNDIMVVRSAGSEKYEICDYNLVTNDAAVQEYQIEQYDSEAETITQFGKVAFSNADGSGALYVADSNGHLYYTRTLTLKDSPAMGDETFFDMAYVFNGNYALMARNGYVFRFAEIGAGTAWTRLADTGSVRSMLDISGGKCLITTSNGLWYYDEIEQSEDTVDPQTGGTVTERWYEGECVQLREVEAGINTIRMYVYDGNERYLYASGQSMLSSGNYKLWRPVLDWCKTGSGASTGIESINGVYRLNGNTYFAAADNGTYMTKYDYDMVKDTKAFTKDEALSVYDELLQEVISAEVCALISNHVSASYGDHSENAIITQINKHYLNVDLDNITDWSSSTLCNDIEGYADVKNDIINEMHFGEYADGDVIVNVSSYLTPHGPVQQDGISYIMKRWSSGVTELYVNVPTTSSYYIANCFGASNCKHDQSDAYSRKNLEPFGSEVAIQDSTLSTHYTALSVGVASASYHIDNLLDIQINGMSLPLAVYKDQTANGDTGIAGKMYRSYIEPSVVRRCDVSRTDDDGNYVFEFACFGTDAQAVKLMFYDEKSRTVVACVKVVFDANGGEGKMPNQKFVITPDVNGKTVLEQKNLRKCQFTNTSSGHTKVFAGWSILPLADNSNATYEDKTLFPQYKSGQTFEDLMEELGDASRTEELRKNEEIRLYAVWLDYQFSDTDTTLMMASDKSEFFIDSVGVDSSTRLKDKVIVNFGD